MPQIKVYVVDDEVEIRNSICQFLDLENIKNAACEEGSVLLNQIHRDSSAIVISDIRMPNMDGIELLKNVMAIDPNMPVILITGHGDVQMAVDAMRKGAYDFLEKPFDPEQLLAQVKRAIDARILTLSNRELRNALANPERLQNIFLGQSANIQELRERVLDYASSDDHILIRGEIGTGKSIASRAIHSASQAANSPIHIVNCAALSEEELNDRLFEGRTNEAIFKSPNPMSLVLDNINSLPQKMQARLASVIEETENDDRPHIRVIGIETTPNDDELTSELYHKISGKLIEIAPLRERGGDIMLLFNSYLERYCNDYGVETQELTANSATTLMGAEWPGNVRQMMKFSEKCAMKLCNEEDLEQIINSEFGEENQSQMAKGSPLKTQVEAFEEMLIRNALRRHKGSIANVLDELALPRRTLNEKMARYGLSRADFT